MCRARLRDEGVRRRPLGDDDRVAAALREPADLEKGLPGDPPSGIVGETLTVDVPKVASASHTIIRTNKEIVATTQIQSRLFFGGGGSATSPRSRAHVAAKRRGSLSPSISAAETPSA